MRKEDKEEKVGFLGSGTTLKKNSASFSVIYTDLNISRVRKGMDPRKDYEEGGN